MSERSIILLTGANGFVGSQVAQRLIADPDRSVVAMVRAPDAAAAARRLRRAWWDCPELVAAIGNQVEAMAGDVCKSDLGLDDAALRKLTARITHVIHTSAELRLEAPLEELRSTNVGGTRHVLDIARKANAERPLQRFAYVSTAYVSGRRTGQIDEDSFTAPPGFTTAYEQSKFEAEALVRAAQAEFPVSIFRPAMIVGDSKTGAIKSFNTIYVPLQLYLTGKLPVVPTSPSLRLNIVPVDYVADCIARLTFDPRAERLTFHLVAPEAALPTAGELMESVRDWARKELNVHLRPSLFIDLRVPNLPVIPKSLRLLQPYLQDRHQFRRDNLDRLIGADAPDWHAYLPPLLEYAVAHGFLNRSERTAYEQVVHRLHRKRWPVKLHDITVNGVITRATTEVEREIHQAAAALRAMGIGSGDRVAVIGCNSTRYLTLDVAIGLIGAVSVPLYPTSPPGEIDTLLETSGASLLLIGASQVLARARELRTTIPILAFCDMPVWQSFLKSGASAAAAAPSGVPSFTDLATLRYTSGTTGPPKAAAFSHAGVRWMAETLAGLLPWQARTGHVNYLSFLPMNHVVEGMLATYGAYFIPAAVDIYFLEDFHLLPAGLRVARPSVFFSVPRVYEKIWQGIQSSLPGRQYLRARPGLWRNLLRAVVRRGTLRKSGLDRCSELMVGSAPVSDMLLRSFQELGIDIHSAYGLTEAPLVTMNRVAANRLGTAGQPLPQTDLTIAGDGEVLVRGPQVMRGYYGRTEQPFQDGWLCTGDLGHITSDGFLVIDGRKKEMIATAYGKKVNPDRIEGLLRRIPGVSEAMLVGEGRPYCSALLWTTDGISKTSIERGVEEVNTQVSHAEQVKHWTVLVDDLSIERGDVTPNLKLKRSAIAARYASEIEGLYANAPAEALVLR